jgi:ubiquitin carboxyl-terminal hydrolase 8
MWKSQQVIVPKGFRHTLSKCNEVFGTDEQQDTQEYINFLIDGLHEDTNLRP